MLSPYNVQRTTIIVRRWCIQYENSKIVCIYVDLMAFCLGHGRLNKRLTVRNGSQAISITIPIFASSHRPLLDSLHEMFGVVHWNDFIVFCLSTRYFNSFSSSVHHSIRCDNSSFFDEPTFNVYALHDVCCSITIHVLIIFQLNAQHTIISIDNRYMEFFSFTHLL